MGLAKGGTGRGEKGRTHCNSLRVGAIVGIPMGLQNSLACSAPPLQGCLAGHAVGVQSVNVAPCNRTDL